jgi:cell division protease FtsH
VYKKAKAGENVDNFKDIIGYVDIKIELERVLDTITNTKKYKALGVKVPTGILLYGNPGVGKTLSPPLLLRQVADRISCAGKINLTVNL